MSPGLMPVDLCWPAGLLPAGLFPLRDLQLGKLRNHVFA